MAALEDGNEHSGLVKGEAFIDQLRNCKRF
jgi:hypothetical protein